MSVIVVAFVVVVVVVESASVQCISWHLIGLKGVINSPCQDGGGCVDDNAGCVRGKCQCVSGYFLKDGVCGENAEYCAFIITNITSTLVLRQMHTLFGWQHW